MSSPRPLSIALLVGLLAAGTAVAQLLGTAFTFQGSLRNAGQPAQGSHDFQFDLYAVATDGAALTAPVSRPAVNVVDGVFTVSLDFGAQFVGAPRWLQIRVRQTGSPTYTTLAPRQPVTPAPYAQHADMVAANSIISANIEDRTIVGADIALSAITTAELANGSVTNPKLASAAVTNAKLADGSVTNPKLASLAVTSDKLTDGAVTNAKLGSSAITNDKLADFSVSAAKVDPNQIQLRISGQCSRGTPMIGVTRSGAVICDQPLRTPASGSFSERVSVAIRGDGRPLVAYAGPTLMDCNNAECTTWATRTLSGVDIASGVSLAIRSDGMPVIAYGLDFAPGLFLYVCTSTDCTTGNNIALDTTGTTGSAFIFPTLALAGDVPRIAYYHWTDGITKLFVCNIAACNTGGLIRNLPAGSTPRTLRIRPNGVPVVGLRDFNLSQSRLFDCNDATCSSGTVRDLNAQSGLRHTISIAVRADNRPVASAYHQDFALAKPYNLSTHSCVDAGCTSNARTLLDTEAIVYGSSIAVRTDGRPLIAYLAGAPGFGGATLRLADCDFSCSTATLRVLDQFNLATDQEVSMALRADGRPVIAYSTRSPSEVRVLVCSNPNCQ